jgi:hypothetical protein
MSTLKKSLKVAGTLLLGLVLFCYVSAHLVVRSETFRNRIQSELSARTGYEVRIDDLWLTPWLGLGASGLSISREGKVLFQGKRIDCFLLPHDFFRGRIHRLSLEEPVLRLSLQDLFGSEEKTSPDFSIGTLNVDGGEFVLETGQGDPLALRSISLKANNVDLRGETGLQLRTYIPAVNGSAALSILGGPTDRRAEIVMHQGEESSLKRILSQTSKEKAVFQARFQMKARERESYEVKGSGTVDGFRWGPESIHGEFASLLESDAKLTNLRLALDLKMAQLPTKLLFTEISLDSGPVTAMLRGNYSSSDKTLTLQKINLASSIGALDGEGAIALEETATLTSKLRLRDVMLASLKPLMPAPLRTLTYTGKMAADINLSGPYKDLDITGLAWNDGAKIVGEGISLSQLSLKVPFRWTRSSLQVKAGGFQGKDLVLGRKGETQFRIQEASLLGDVVKESEKPLQIAGEFQIRKGGFSGPDQSKVGEGLNAKGRLSCEDCAGDPSFKGEARIESLELLWNKFFGDFKNEKPVIRVEGGYRRETDELTLKPLRVALASAGELEIKGSVKRLLGRPEFNLEVLSDGLHHAGFYDFFVRDAFQTVYPILGRVGLAGSSQLAIRTQGSLESFTAEGKLRVQQGEIQERSGRWRVGPIALDLPLRLRFPQAIKETEDNAPVGRLSVREIKTLSTTVPEIRTAFILWNNSLRFPEPIRVSLFGGTCVIEKLAWQDVIGSPEDLSFSLRLDGLRLLELTETLGWHRFGGTLSGSIPAVHWEGDSLRSDGAIALDVFGGRVTIRGMEIEEPLSPVRSIKMDARLDGLDLEQASETFEFGRISGVLEGTVEGLVIARGQPSQFQADIHTIEKSGISQWISVEALNKITVLSSGNDAGLLYGGLAGFFDFFRYSKLGFKAVLKNDRMLLRGIETKNQQEYLVVGTLLPPTVNIISHTQEIGFSELLRRLERVQKKENAKSETRP